MKNLSKLQDFFYEEIYPDLKFLEDKRLSILSFLKILAIILLVLSFILFMIVKDVVIGIEPIIAIFAASFAIFLFAYQQKMKEFSALYKDFVIEKIIAFVNPSLYYSKYACISKYEYDNSLLFTTSIDKYKGDDLVKGVIDGVKIKFSEIHTQKKRKTSKSKTYYETIFKGLFFISDFNKHFKGKTILIPDKTEKLLGSFAHMFQKFSAHGELVKLDNPEFEKNFIVYSSDQIEARYILSHSLMQNILKLKEVANKNLSISFVGSKIYLAFHMNESLFEPKLHKKVTNFSEVEKYFKTIKMVVDIVNTLNLDVKIWSKK